MIPVKKGRHKKVRYIQRMPKVVQFSPRGWPGRPEEMSLSIDEFEALKLADFQGFSQTHGAVAMRVSRPTFGRLLREARKHVADAIVNGKIIKIRMGDAQVGVKKKDFSADNIEEEIKTFKLRTGKIARQIKQISRKSSKKLKGVAGRVRPVPDGKAQNLL